MPLTNKYSVRIRDPIHGTIHLSREETQVIDSPVYQRLRMIKQLGLADLAFPGATHTRYSHGLGTMHIASRMIERLLGFYELPPDARDRFAATVRLAALFHDLGHAPLSHTTEAFMPPIRSLELGAWGGADQGRRASHEDYTLKLLLDSDLSERVRIHITPELGVTPEDIATLIAGRSPAGDDVRFVVGGLNFLPLMRQCVSSELDADRMDYLLRDSYFAGVPYGRYDLEWIIDNLRPVEQEDAIYLGLDARASFSFEDFLLSRYHMFTSVYFHQIPIGYEVMLRRFFQDDTKELEMPATVEGYLRCDDVYLWQSLRSSKNEWARRIVDRRAYRMLYEVKGFDQTQSSEDDLDQVFEAVQDAGIDAITHTIKGELSKYFKWTSQADENKTPTPLYVVDGAQSIPVQNYTPLYKRYASGVHLKRLYVNPDQLSDAKDVLKRMGAYASQRPRPASSTR